MTFEINTRRFANPVTVDLPVVSNTAVTVELPPAPTYPFTDGERQYARSAEAQQVAEAWALHQHDLDTGDDLAWATNRTRAWGDVATPWLDQMSDWDRAEIDAKWDAINTRVAQKHARAA